MPQRTRAQRLNGLFPLSYMGVVPVSPVNFVIDNRPPTVNDYKNFYVGDLWLDVDTNTPPTNEDIWMLVSVASNSATWINFGGGDTETLSGDSGVNPVFPDGADNINVFGDNAAGITVSGDGVNTLTVTTTGILAHDYVTDNGTATPAAGILNIITNQAVNNAGATFQFSGAGNTVQLNTTDTTNHNTFISADCGNLTLTGTQNMGFCEGGLTALTTGSSNLCAGYQSGLSLQDGINNTFLGTESGEFLISGTDSVFIGHQAGQNIVTNSFNVAIGSRAANAIPGDSNVFIGYQSGSGALASARNSCIGQETGSALNSSDDNVLIGHQAGITLTGSDSVLIGSGVAPTITTGGSNVIIGAGSGSAYTGAESNNILLTNPGVIADSNAIRIGTQGSHTTAFMAGITGVTVSNQRGVNIDSVTGQLGVVPLNAAWTPILTFGGATTGITYTTQTGSYVINGKILFFEFNIELSSKGTAVGDAAVTNLPASLVFGSTAICQISAITLGGTYAYVTGNSSLTNVTLRRNDPAGAAFGNLDDTMFTNTSSINMSAFGFIN